MPIEILEKKITTLTLEQQNSVYDFIDFLISQNKLEKNNSDKTIFRTPGGLIGKFKMADDFDTTPDCFKEYM